MATNTPHKVFTVTMEFELGPRKTSRGRLKAAYAAAVACAARAVQDELLDEGHLAHVHTGMTYSYLFEEEADEISAEADGSLVVLDPGASILADDVV